MDVKKVIDILLFPVPLMILLSAVIRRFLNKQPYKGAWLYILSFLLLVVGVIRFFFFSDNNGSGNSGPKLAPLQVSKHSTVFNESMEGLLNKYFSLSDVLANNNQATISESATAFKMVLDSFKVTELKVDTLIYLSALQPWQNMKAEAASIIADPSIDEKRSSFNVLSNELFSLISTIHYDMAKLYWLECESAFGEDKPGNWMSKTEKSTGPYGKKECAEVKTEINFVPVDTTKVK
jgi:Cu(I)/Ag(I) efflux system membrane fusion protein